MTTTFGEQLPDLAAPDSGVVASDARGLALPEAVLRIPVSVQVVIGSARIPLAQVAKLAPGTTLTLEEKLGAPARMLVNGREVARGTLFVVDEGEGRLGLTITEVAGPSADP